MKQSVFVILLSILHLTAFAQSVKINKKSVRWLQENAKPVEVGQKDFSFLDEYIKDKRIVVLGEQLHGVKEFEEIRADIIEYLHQKHGFDVLLIESDMDAIDYVNRNKKQLTPKEMLRAFHAVWYSESMKLFISFLQKNPSIDLAGFDSQLHFLPSYSLIASEYDSSFADITKRSNSIFNDKSLTNSDYKMIIDSLVQLHKAQLTRLPNDENYEFITRIIQNKINELERILPSSPSEMPPFWNYRDSMMADNMEWLIQEKYPNRKIIIWAATPHVAACTDCTAFPEAYFSGKKLFENKDIRDSTYILITSLFEGTTSFFNFIFPTPSYRYDGVERLFNEVELPSFFVDISTPKIKKRNEWITEPIKIFPTEGYKLNDIGIKSKSYLQYSTLVPRNCFDGIIYFKKVTASILMDSAE